MLTWDAFDSFLHFEFQKLSDITNSSVEFNFEGIPSAGLVESVATYDILGCFE